MLLDYELFKPIRNFGLLIIVVGVAGLLCFVVFYNDPDFYLGSKIFIAVASTFNIFMGYNIVSRNKLGFKSLKICLYLIYPGFPLGYFYAKKLLYYIKTNNIQEFYSKSIKIQ